MKKTYDTVNSLMQIARYPIFTLSYLNKRLILELNKIYQIFPNISFKLEDLPSCLIAVFPTPRKLKVFVKN